MSSSKAVVERVYGPFTGRERVNGVTFDGRSVWFASGPALVAFDPDTGEETRTLEVPARAGTAFDGRYLYQVTGGEIHKLDPDTGRVLAAIPLPPETPATGLTWAEGSLWLGVHNGRKILQLDPQTGRVLKTVVSDRFVTGVTFTDGELWHGAVDGQNSEIRRVDPDSSVVLETLELPAGFTLSGLEAGGERFYCGGGGSRKVLAVKRPRRAKSG